jgi:hypothetical protein
MSPNSTNELKSLAHGIMSVNSYSACIVNGVRFVVYSRDVQRTTQNSGVGSIGEDDTQFYGQLEDILLLDYIYDYSVMIFRGKWFDTRRKGGLIKEDNTVYIDVGHELYVGKPWYDSDRLILASQAKQVFYLHDPTRGENWRVVEEVHHRKMWDHPSINNENEIDVFHETHSSDYQLVVEEGCGVGTSTANPDWDNEIDESRAIDIDDDDIAIEIDDDEIEIDDDDEIEIDDDEIEIDDDQIEIESDGADDSE